MRTDRTRGSAVLEAEAWKNQKYSDNLFAKLDNGPPFYKSNSFSGSEPNHMFLNDGRRFWDVTLVSNADHKGDGRSFARIDLDNDGWIDIALMSTNKPRLKLLRNRLGEVCNNQRYRIRLQGAQSDAIPDPRKSNRDGVGARVLVTYQSGRKQLLHRQSGEGNVAQNSELIWVGFEPDDPVVQIEVRWPNGHTQVETELSVENVNWILESTP